LYLPADLPDTPANREQVIAMLEKVLRQQNPSAGFVKREEPD
jgi:hypothetical protein